MTPLVSVVWWDAHTLNDVWAEREQIESDGPRVINSVGWLLKGMKAGHVCLAESVDDTRVGHVLAIPNGMVKRISLLNEGQALPIEPAG